MEYVHKTYENLKFSSDVEIDESLFGRKIKYNKGRPGGTKIWIFGIVERNSNMLVLYPVDNRNAETLIPLIQKHVQPGTRIFSDNWAAYFKLNDMGYPHFTVTHKTTFKQVYRNVDTGDYVHCNTNRIEGAWKISKDHFRKINGTNTKLFEQHLCEVIWRNHVHRQNLYESFFSLLKSVFTLDSAAAYEHPVPLFGTWTPPSTADEEAHNYTIIQDVDERSSSDEEILSSAPDDNLCDKGPQSDDTSNPASPVYSQSSQHSGDSTVEATHMLMNPSAASTPAVKSKSALPQSEYETDTDSDRKHCHPDRFVTVRRKKKSTKSFPKRQTHRQTPHLYGKDAFQYQFSSSDSDFI